MSLVGIYTFNASCTVTDDVNSANNAMTTTNIENAAVSANAGPDDHTCNGSYQLQSNLPGTNETGTWSSSNINISFDDNHSATATATIPDLGLNTLTWEITNGTCTATDAIVINNASVTADAGLDQNLCDVIALTLSGNNPSLILNGMTNTGTWTGGAVTNPNQFDSEITNLAEETITLTWEVSNSLCTASDQMDITVVHSPTVNNEPAALQNATIGTSVSFFFDLTALSTITYQWEKDGTPVVDIPSRITGSQTATLTINSVEAGDAGSYSCKATTCAYIMSNASVLSVSTSLDNMTSKGITIYPNPSTGIVNVVTENSVKLIVFDITGKVVLAKDLTNKANTVDMSSFPQGIYNFVIKSDHESTNYRVIKR
jgi:hypothetical protein